MGLLDDARRLAELHTTTDFGGRVIHDNGFCGLPEDCAHLALPKIVAALEAAEALVERNPYHGQSDMGATVCGFCGEEIGMFWEEDGARHWGDCPWQALVAALRAGELTPN